VCDKKLNKNYMRKHKKTMHNLNDAQDNPINMNKSPKKENSNNEKDSYFCSFCMETFETSEDLDDHTSIEYVEDNDWLEGIDEELYTAKGCKECNENKILLNKMQKTVVSLTKIKIFSAKEA